MTVRMLPHDDEAERALLGAMLVSEKAIGDTRDLVQAGDLYRKGNRIVFEAVRGMYDRGEPVDPLTVAAELERLGKLEDAGGRLGIAKLAEDVPVPGAASTYARIVADKAGRRGLIEAARQIEADAYEGAGTLGEITAVAEGVIFEAGHRRRLEQVRGAEELVYEYIARLGQPGRDGIPTGFRDLDRWLRGLKPGQLIVVAARPGIGKSTFVTNVGRNVALDLKRAVAMWSLEMADHEIAERLVHSEAHVKTDDLLEPTTATLTALTSGADRFVGSRLWIDDNASATVTDIRARARIMRATVGLDLVVVDYLQLMDTPRGVDRHEAIAGITRALKVLAKDLEVPVIAVSQLNREPERGNRKPKLSDLRESGAIEQDADVVLFLHRENPDEGMGTVEVIVAKNRAGATGSAPLTFLPAETRFADHYGGRK